MPAVQLNSDDANVANSTSSSRVLDAIPNITNSGPIEELESKTETKNNDPKEREEEEENNDNEWSDILENGQLKMKVIKKGEPDTKPRSLDFCKIKLKGVLENGVVIDEHESLEIQLGYHEVVQGVELIVPFMDVGEKVILVVGPRFGYGTIGNPPSVPPDVTITYFIELLKSYPEPRLEDIPLGQRKRLANVKRERGNWWYSRQDAIRAVQCYRKALDLLDETVHFFNEQGYSSEYSDEEIRDIIEQKLRIYNNLAAAQLMTEAYDSALMSVNKVIQFDPKNVKALFRKGKILTAKGCINEAVEVLRQAFLLQPENSAVKMELSRCVKIQQTEKQHEKILCKKMLGQDKKNKSADISKRKNSSYWNKVLGTAATATVMAAIAITIGYRFKNYSFL